MLKKIAISEARIGMFVHSVEGPFLQHSLWKTRFVIKDEEMLGRVRNCGAAEFYIDISQGVDVARSRPTGSSSTSSLTAPAPKKSDVRKSMADELQTAANILKRSK